MKLTNPNLHVDASFLHAQILSTLKNQCAGQVERFPQYKDHFDDRWTVGVFTEQFKTKGGVRFEAGELALVKPETEPGQTTGFVTAWSNRGTCEVSVERGSFTYIR